MQSLHFSPLKIASITDGAFWGGDPTVAERIKKNGNDKVWGVFFFLAWIQCCVSGFLFLFIFIFLFSSKEK